MFFSVNSGAAGDAETAALHFANMAGVAVTGFVLCGIALVLLGHFKNAAVLWTAQVLGALCFMIALAVEMIYLMSVPLLLDGEVTANGQMNWQAPCLNVSLMISVMPGICRLGSTNTELGECVAGVSMLAWIRLYTKKGVAVCTATQ